MAADKNNQSLFVAIAVVALAMGGVAGPRVVALHRAIKPQSERYARLYVNVLLAELPTSVREHDAIAAAIAKGDSRAAQNAVETNWHNAAERLAEVIAEHGERGHWLLVDPAASPTRTRRGTK